MPQKAKPAARASIVNDLALRADLPTVADELGIHVTGRGSSTPKALCPFHEDKKPSLVFYPSTSSDRGHYHCFACGAHGDVYGLLMRARSCDFRGALEWLAARYNQTLPSAGESKTGSLRTSGMELAAKTFRKQTSSEAEALLAFARDRHFRLETFAKADLHVASANKLTRSDLLSDRETVESLREAGLIRSGELPAGKEGAPLPLDLPYRDFFTQKRVIFPLQDDRARLIGFAGRALEEKDEPKYLYTPGFPRNDTLYRYDNARVQLFSRRAESSQVVNLFVVEGLLDALRLEQLGFTAVAILGSQLSDGQVHLLTRLADDLDREDRALNIHMFLDADVPGRVGLRRSIARLLDLSTAEKGSRFSLDVITPALMGKKEDPDGLLKTCETSEDATARLSGWNYGALEWLVADTLGVDPDLLDDELSRLPLNQKQRAFRAIERLRPTGGWISVLSRFSLFDRTLSEPPQETAGAVWRLDLEAFLTSDASTTSIPFSFQHWTVERSDANKLQHALRVAQASGQRRELPVDEGSWERLEAAIDISIPGLCEILRRGDRPIEPYIATCVPRSDGDFRPKALPSPEVLTVQQYILNELLRDFPGVPLFAQTIPAVRLMPGDEYGWTTGPGINIETVSFGYQLDMSIIEARRLPQREGMFRPYSACWKDFISAIDQRASRCHGTILHVARVDRRKRLTSQAPGHRKYCLR